MAVSVTHTRAAQRIRSYYKQLPYRLHWCCFHHLLPPLHNPSRPRNSRARQVDADSTTPTGAMEPQVGSEPHSRKQVQARAAPSLDVQAPQTPLESSMACADSDESLSKGQGARLAAWVRGTHHFFVGEPANLHPTASVRDECRDCTIDAPLKPAPQAPKTCFL